MAETPAAQRIEAALLSLCEALETALDLAASAEVLDHLSEIEELGRVVVTQTRALREAANDTTT